MRANSSFRYKVLAVAAALFAGLGYLASGLLPQSQGRITSEAMGRGDPRFPQTFPLAGASITPITSVSDPASGISFSGDAYDVTCTTTAAASVLYPALHDGSAWTIFGQYPCTNTGSPTKITCRFPAKRGSGYTWNAYKTGAATLSSCTAEQVYNAAQGLYIPVAPPASGPGSGTVTSVAASVPAALLTLSGSPITTSGTLAIDLALQAQGVVFAGPTGASPAAPTFRSLVAADLPSTAVTPGSYTNASLTVDQQGRLTAASSGTGVSFANPSASIGLSAVNGVATTAMRSDAAPAIDQAIAPTWSGLHTFSLAATFTTSVLTDLLDARTAAPLVIGTTNATGITLQKTTTLAAGQSLSMAAGAGGLSLGSGTGSSTMTTGTFTWTGSSNSDFNVTSSGITGNIALSAGGGGLVTLNSTDAVELKWQSGTRVRVSTDLTLRPLVTPPAGGSTSARVLFGDEADFGLYYGTGAPTVSAAKGSLYLRRDGSGTGDRMYVNTNGSTTWTAVTTAS